MNWLYHFYIYDNLRVVLLLSLVCHWCNQYVISSEQVELIKSGAVETTQADQLVNDTLIPMIGKQQKLYESNMEQMDVRISIYLYVSLYISIYLYVSLCISIYLHYISVYLYISLYISIYLYYVIL